MGQQSNTNPNLPQRNPAWIALLLLLANIASTARAQSTISALSIPLILPSAVVFDSTGNLYIADTSAHLIHRVGPQGHITTIAGTGTQGFAGDNGPATAALLDFPQGLVLASNTLRSIVLSRPQTLSQLKTIHGLGHEKIEKFGPSIIELCTT